jgi:uncharacterized protein YciI
MLYALLANDMPNSLERRLAARPRHLARLAAMTNEGRVALAGPFPAIDAQNPGASGFTGSLIVAEFADLAAATQWAAADPYVLEGVYANWDVRPFWQVSP